MELLNNISSASSSWLQFLLPEVAICFYSFTFSPHVQIWAFNTLLVPLLKQACYELVKMNVFLLMKSYIPCWQAAYLHTDLSSWLLLKQVDCSSACHTDNIIQTLYYTSLHFLTLLWNTKDVFWRVYNQTVLVIIDIHCIIKKKPQPQCSTQERKKALCQN